MNENINNPKIACVYHRIDIDGWMSAAIIKRHYPSAVMIGFHYGDDIPDLTAYNRVYMCDVSFPREHMIKLASMGSAFKWFDHHISAINELSDISISGSRDPRIAACELTWNYFNNRSSELVRKLGAYDCFSSRGTSEEKEILVFQYGARANITCWEDALSLLEADNQDAVISSIYKDGISIYSYLCIEAKQIVKSGFEMTIYEEFSFGRDMVPRKFLVINRERFNPINFQIDYHSMGYDGVISTFYDGIIWNVSFYNDNGNVDCNKIAKRFGGGGHKGAAGCRIINLELLKIK